MEYFSIGLSPSLSPLHLATMGSLLHTNVVATIQRLCITVARPGFYETGCLCPWLPHSSFYGLVPTELHCEGLSLDYNYLRRPKYWCPMVVRFERCWDRWALAQERPQPRPSRATVGWCAMKRFILYPTIAQINWLRMTYILWSVLFNNDLFAPEYGTIFHI